MRFSEYTNKYSKQADSMDKLFESYSESGVAEYDVDDASKNQATADELGVSRQYINQTLKSVIPRIWRNYRENIDTESSPYEAFKNLVITLGIRAEDYKDFFAKLPQEAKDEIENDAKDLGLVRTQ